MEVLGRVTGVLFSKQAMKIVSVVSQTSARNQQRFASRRYATTSWKTSSDKKKTERKIRTMDAANPVVETALGKVRGKMVTSHVGDNYYSFQGIPYAKAPVGSLRFKDPQPAEPWTGELDATKEGPECPSSHMMFLYFIGKEDNCLNLNVYLREMPKADSPLKPVMVWIHGGAFIQGSNRTELYGPDYLMREDVIQVSINYRLGVFGFLSLEDESLGIPGNAGLKDQVQALKWVRDNIKNFGGDPNNVTIYGESAGAASVHYLLLSPTTKGLFHKAIMQSGCTLNPWALGQKGVAIIAKYLGIKDTDEKQVLEQLMKICPKKLVTAEMKYPELFIPVKRAFGPVVEKPSPEAFLTEDPLKLLKEGNYHKVPILMGANTNEGLLYELAKKLRNLKSVPNFDNDIPQELGIPAKSEELSKVSEKIKKFYKMDELSSDQKILALYELKSDHHFIHGIHRSLTLNLETNPQPTYFYVFSFEGEFNYFRKFATSKALPIHFVCIYLLNNFDREGVRNLLCKIANGMGYNKTPGVCHADELGYLFRTFFSPKMVEGSRESETVKRMVTLWTNFAKFGNPTPEGNDLNLTWQPATKDNHLYLDIGDELLMKKNPFHERNQFWDEIYKEHAKNYTASLAFYAFTTYTSQRRSREHTIKFHKFFPPLATEQTIFDQCGRRKNSSTTMSSEPRVIVESGILEGYVCDSQVENEKSYFCFQGIPYAKPPLGELRFKAPQPVEPWTGVKEVKKDGNACYSRDMLNPEKMTGSEDCLFLNVYTPKLPIKQRDGLNYDLRPVMVYIHGGSFTSGSNSKQMYGPDFLIREDVVIVSINYRLGFLGFFHLNDKTLGVTGNAGFKDMVLALRWVKNNIKNFNGDPDNITIFGESAGAVSIHLLVLSPITKGLFHRAIVQSGCALNTWAECENMAPKIAKALNLEDGDERKLLKKLREMKVEDLFSLQESFPDPWDVSIRRLVGFVVEDPDQQEEAFLTQHPNQILEKGEYNPVPIMMGFTSREGMLVHAKEKKSFKELTPNIETIVPTYFDLQIGSPPSKKVSDKIMDYYFHGQDPDEADIDIAYKLWSDNLFIRDIYRSLKAHAESSGTPVYAYEVTLETSLNIFKKFAGITTPGVSHADDLFYIFKTIMTGKLEPDSPEDKGVRRFCKLWTNFAKYGNPNPPTTDPLLQTDWKTFTKNEKNYLEIGLELAAKNNPLKDRMSFWEDLYNHRNDLD
ncbi:uncharacterized protein LOC123307172 [Coccinella septempunctata]|uniref:uncharacterized protein LOC123307172 n=1 Tax=Coccinella septempunctata TaxID=41139 RepID=UPI001D08C08B|nr:uncharacterized protein LOC123307172 [Coccinella septempunctata]